MVHVQAMACSYLYEATHNLTQGPVKMRGTMDWALGQTAEEAESVRTVWESGPSVPDWDWSGDSLLADRRLLEPPSARLLYRSRTTG